MSRLAKKPIILPPGVNVNLNLSSIEIKGQLGSINHSLPSMVSIRTEGNQIWVDRLSDDKKIRAAQGLIWALVRNAVLGVSTGFSKRLLMSGVGYRALKEKNSLILQVGFSRPIVIEPPEGIAIEVEKPDLIAVKGINKELVGLVASQIRSVRPPEPYKGKGIRYEGEIVRRKAGKAIGKAKK